MANLAIYVNNKKSQLPKKERKTKSGGKTFKGATDVRDRRGQL